VNGPFGDPLVEAGLARAFAAGARALGLVTVEDERALIVAEAVAERLDRTLHSWSAAAGVDGSGRDRDLGGLLARIASSDETTLWLLYEPGADLRSAAQLRMLRELARCGVGPALILVADDPAGLPEIPELERQVLPMPALDQLSERLRGWLRGCVDERPNLASAIDEAPTIAQAGVGLSLTRFDRTVAAALASRSASLASLRAALLERRLNDACVGVLERVEIEAPLADPSLDHVRPPPDLDRAPGSSATASHPRDPVRAWAPALAWLRERGSVELRGGSRVRAIGLVAAPGCGLAHAVQAGAAASQLPLVRLPAAATGGEPATSLAAIVAAIERAAPVAVWLDASDPPALLEGLARWLAHTRAPVVVLLSSSAAEPPSPSWRDQLDALFFVDLPDAERRAELLATRLAQPPITLAEPLDSWLAAARAAEGCSQADLDEALAHARLRAHPRPLALADFEAALAARPPVAVRESERLVALRRWASGLANRS
jgi:hypothetical protein